MHSINDLHNTGRSSKKGRRDVAGTRPKGHNTQTEGVLWQAVLQVNVSMLRAQNQEAEAKKRTTYNRHT